MLGKRLSRIRSEKGFTQQKMADFLFMTVRNYQKYESGETYPPLDKLVKIADILDVSADYLLCRDAFLSAAADRNGAPSPEPES